MFEKKVLESTYADMMDFIEDIHDSLDYNDFERTKELFSKLARRLLDVVEIANKMKVVDEEISKAIESRVSTGDIDALFMDISDCTKILLKEGNDARV